MKRKRSIAMELLWFFNDKRKSNMVPFNLFIYLFILARNMKKKGRCFQRVSRSRTLNEENEGAIQYVAIKRKKV